MADDFPEDYFTVKVLPELLKSIEFGGGGPKVFASVMKIGAKISDEEFNIRITPVIVRLFSNPDRAIRVCLLQNLPSMIDHLSTKIINDKIFPQMVPHSPFQLYVFFADQPRLLVLQMQHRYFVSKQSRQSWRSFPSYPTAQPMGSY